MKKYIGLAVGAFLIFALLLYAYSQTKSDFLTVDKEIYTSIVSAQQSETSLDKDVLRIHSLLLQDYDTLVTYTQKLENFCNFQVDNPKAYSLASDEYKESFQKYCEAMRQKIYAIESFKSQNAVYRNSIFFLHAKANHWTFNNVRKMDFRQFTIDSILSYALLPDEKSREIASNVLMNEKQNVNSADYVQIKNHGLKIIQTRSAIVQLTHEIVSNKTSVLFDNLHSSFVKQYEEEINRSHFFQKVLFNLSILLICIIIFSILKIWNGARALNDVNLNLEKRISERTEELVKSRQTILDQQQTVMTISKMSALGEMAGGVAHEINTPLAVIQMRTDQLLESINEEPQDKETIVNCLNAIDQTIKRISTIVLGLRSFARDGRKDPMTFVPVKNILEDTFSLCHEKFNSHGVELNYTCDETHQIQCRPGEVSQVILNFLNNSYDAIQGYNKKWIRINVSDVQDSIKISIVDSGRGIPAEIQEKLMQPFFTTKEVGKGTGLGLSISKGIIESHGGKIVLDSKNENTKFDIYFPKKNS